jgi:hypothetical protein
VTLHLDNATLQTWAGSLKGRGQAEKHKRNKQKIEKEIDDEQGRVGRAKQ